MKRLYIDLGAALAVALVLSFPALGQISQEAPRAATVMGTVTDVNGDVIPNATVVLKEVEGSDPRTILTTENGMFEFHDVTPDITYQVDHCRCSLRPCQSCDRAAQGRGKATRVRNYPKFLRLL